MRDDPFDTLADRYDAWFDTEPGASIFRSEVACLSRLMPPTRAGWVEVGVGTGRFAVALGVGEGVDPSVPMLLKAAARGVRTRQASAEELPYADASLEGILLVVTLCFLKEPEQAMAEFARVLKQGGKLLVGVVPSESAWAEFYRQKAAEGHPFYSVARFYTCAEVIELASEEGFRLVSGASTLPGAPGQAPDEVVVSDGVRNSYGFVGMLFESGATDRKPTSSGNQASQRQSEGR